MCDAYIHMMNVRCMSVFILVLYIWLVVDFVAATLCHLYKLEQWPTLCTQTQVFNKIQVVNGGSKPPLRFQQVSFGFII